MLELTCCCGWSGLGANDPRYQPSWEFTQMNSPWHVCHQCLYPQGEPLPTSPGDPLRSTVRPGPGSYEIIAFGLSPRAHEILCASLKTDVSISPSPVGLLQSSLTSLQNQLFWGQLLFLMPNYPGWGDWCGTQNSRSCGRISATFWRYGIWLHHKSIPPTPSHCGSFFRYIVVADTLW